MSEQASTSKGIAKRYAVALFDLANETDDIPVLEKNVSSQRDRTARYVFWRLWELGLQDLHGQNETIIDFFI